MSVVDKCPKCGKTLDYEEGVGSMKLDIRCEHCQWVPVQEHFGEYDE